jgi:hypothetical protein
MWRSPHGGRAVIVLPIARLGHGLRTALYRFVKSVIGVFDLKCDIAHAVAVLLDMLGRRMLRRQRRRQMKFTRFCRIT